MTSPHETAHGGDRVAQALKAHGVPVVFTLCGGHISPILVAAKARGIRIVDTRDEVTAVFAADATARLTGIPGVAAVTAGPGLTNTITALKNAQLAQSPVLLIGGAAPTALQGRGALQDIDQRPLIAPHVKLVKQVRRVADLGPAVSEALAASRSGIPGPVFVECPVDLLYEEATIRQWYTDAAGKGTSIPDRALRWYLNRHASRLFAGTHRPFVSSVVEVPLPHPGRRRDRPRRRGPVPRRTSADGDRQPVAQPGHERGAPCRRGIAAGNSRLPLRHGPRPARARTSPADAPRTAQGSARIRLRGPRGSAVRLPPRLRQTREAQRHPHRRESQREGGAAQPHAHHPRPRRRRPLRREAG
jgi:hypothetical protein